MTATIDRVLCPVDFSPGSERALEFAVDLADRLGAKIHVLHVYQLPVYALPDGALVPGPDFASRLMDDVHTALGEMSARHPEAELITSMVEGVPHQQILQACRNDRIDLVVMGTHGRTGLEHFLVGSVAERVVRTSRVPVVTVPLRD